MKTFGTLAAALAATPAICIVSPASSSTIAQPLDIDSIRAFLEVKREQVSSDPISVSVTDVKKEEIGLTTQDEIKRLFTQAGHLSARRAKLEHELSSYGNLSEDWDDRGAVSPSKLTLRLARNLMRWAADNGFMPLRSYTSPNGEIGLVWEAGEGYADLSLGEDATVSFYIRNRAGSQELFSPHRVALGELPGEFWSLAATL
jgi:hypothetical protein